MRHSRRLALGIWTAAVVLVAPVLAEDHMVAVGPSNTFSPQNLDITAGDTVTWTNNGGFHNVVANDGFFRLRRGNRLLVDIEDLDNDAQRINRVRFGQVSKGKKATAGQIYYDNFKSEWEVEGE